MTGKKGLYSDEVPPRNLSLWTGEEEEGEEEGEEKNRQDSQCSVWSDTATSHSVKM